MAKLRFFARNDADGPLLVTVPGSRAQKGQAPEYVGRRFVVGDPKAGVGASHPATAEPFECDSESDVGQRLVQLTRRDACLWPADKETAAACSVEFVPVAVKDGFAEILFNQGAASAFAPPISKKKGES